MGLVVSVPMDGYGICGVCPHPFMMPVESWTRYLTEQGLQML